jgi:NAD(P)H dehydrogenase (quinone)
MILVTGATGHFGKLAINFLIRNGIAPQEIIALVREEEKAKEIAKTGVVLRLGNYNDYDSLEKAFTGVDKLLFVSGSDINNRITQHQNVIQAAKAAGVKHIVYTSFQRKNETTSSPLWIVAQSHIQTEKWLQESELQYTILKNNLYLDFLPGFIGEKMLETGVIYVPAQYGKISAVLRSEMAEATANILTTGGHNRKVYDFTNTEAVSYQEIAEKIATLTNKPIQYVSPSANEYAQTLTNLGVPAEAVAIFTSFAVAQSLGELDVESNDLSNLLGRKPTSVLDFLSGLYA